MSRLSVFHVSDPRRAHKILCDGQDIAATLAREGIRFERWLAEVPVTPEMSSESIMAAYAEPIDQLRAEGGYITVDVISMHPEHSDRQTLREKFLDEHTHSEDEVRFFVAGKGLFCLHLGEWVYQVLCEQNDLLAVPAGTRHWFDMGPQPSFTAIRFFNNPQGWVARYTGDPLARDYPRLEAA